MTTPNRLMIIGKRGGILHWYEDVLSAAGPNAYGFALNHSTLITRALKGIFGVHSGIYKQRVARELSAALTYFSPTHILLIDLFYLRPEINALIASSGAKTAQWIGDKFDEKLADNSSIQRFYFTDSALVKQGISLGLASSYLALATNPPSDALPSWESRSDQLLFVAAPSDNRIKMLEKINYPTLVIGPKWPDIKNPAIQIRRKRLSLKAVRALYSQHKFVLNQINSKNIISGLPSRCFDVTAYGACLITDKVADLELNFAKNHEVLVYTSSSEISGLIKSNSECRLIAEHGQKRAQTDHTYAKRARSILHHE
ncbi:spore maturation protein CgeB [Paraperlucidibaca baekdonensis]|uniref:Spore maturation protein CgeB n=1 Tax=Paraperlucidibaca baekdonensis TaxID=748120 RepID=A0A3E0HAY0_9GAMM|nr:glycosyltransferase [Paraperlucidibaca baekdonensis]REH40382.1 spore maturation protein CgeB [Paraperlucidibaca baekdonensis]